MSFDILEMFGISASSEQEKPDKSKKPKKSKGAVPKTPEAEAGVSPDDAARALAAALDADTGRRKSLDHWKKVVATALGISRLYQKRYDAVLERGVALGLFKVDNDTGSYPFLVRLAEPESEPTPEPEDEGEARVVYRSSDDLKPEPPRPTVPKDPPPDWDPPSFLECGHWTHQKIRKTEDECSEAERARLTDRMCVQPSKMVRVYDPEDCHYCKLGKAPDSYQHQRGKYKQPVPERMRRTAEREQGMGWPGLCCDEDGYYIGGLVNSCRSEGKLCTYHASLTRRKHRED